MVAMLALIMLSGCALSGFIDTEGLFECGFATGEEDVAGAWSITGSGSRSGCARSGLNTDDLDLSSSGLIVVAQDGSELWLESSIGGFDLFGEVEGSCVDFTTTEYDSDIILAWSGTADYNTIVGDFSGSGPDGCYTTGEFTVIID
ncbi:MAG: hypothetical protein ACI8S6_002797 [Myxococcota bacterium]|jgi:hypothetical protein